MGEFLDVYGDKKEKWGIVKYVLELIKKENR